MNMRANLDLDPKDQYLEINTCFPMNKWIGIGFGGDTMFNTEIIMFISAPSPEFQNIVATRVTDKSKHRPGQMPIASPEIYKNFKKSINSQECGPGMMNMYV